MYKTKERHTYRQTDTNVTRHARDKEGDKEMIKKRRRGKK